MKNQMFALLQTLRARARTRKPRPTSLRANKRSQKEAKKAAVMAMKLNNGDISIHNNQVKDDVFCSFLPKKKANVVINILHVSRIDLRILEKCSNKIPKSRYMRSTNR